MQTLIYARYSTDRQDAASIADQVRVCQEYADRQGWPVVGVYDDAAQSGAVNDRPGYQALLAAATAGRVIVVEEISRLWRIQSEQWRAVEHLVFQGVHVVGVRDGVDTRRDGWDLLMAVRGGMNAQARRETAWRTHRALTGKVAAGLVAGAAPYGYRLTDADGGRALEIAPDAAEWVRWIFDRYAAGDGLKTIAAALNRQGVPAPRGRVWAVSTLYGSPAKGTGVLNNLLYTGVYVWNRSRWVQVPGEKKRRRVERPPAEWQRAHLPHLRIVPQPLWDAVKAAQAARGRTGRFGRPSRSLLAGVMRCGGCGGPVIAVDARRYGCAQHQRSGPTVCACACGAPREEAETALVALARDDLAELASPAAIATLHRMVREEMAAGLAEARQGARAARARLDALGREVDRLADAVARAGWSDALGARLKTAEAEHARLAAEVAAAPPLDMDTVPGLVDRYRALLARLGDELRDAGEPGRDALRAVLGPVTLQQGPEGVWLEVEPPTAAAVRLTLGSMVAGARFATCKHAPRRVYLGAA